MPEASKRLSEQVNQFCSRERQFAQCNSELIQFAPTDVGGYGDSDSTRKQVSWQMYRLPRKSTEASKDRRDQDQVKQDGYSIGAPACHRRK
jgi:hypothetical protein